MSAFVNTGSSLKSTNKPAAFLELAHALANAERLASTTDITLNNVTISFDLEARTAAISATLPVVASVAANGNLTVVASNYIGGTGSAYVPGTGELKSTHFAAAFLEMSQVINAAEKAVVTNPPNNISLSVDLENLEASVTASMPLSTSVDATGKVVTTVTDYLP